MFICAMCMCCANDEHVLSVVRGIQHQRRICSVIMCRGYSALQQRTACVQVEADFGFGDAEDEGDEDAEDPSTSPGGESCTWFGNYSAPCSPIYLSAA